MDSLVAFRYVPYGKITNTNHRPYYLDLQVQESFVHSPDEAMSIHARKLKTNIPKRKEKYITNIRKQFQNLELTKAASKLLKEAKSKGKWTSELQHKYEEIDTQATNIMLMSENKCSPNYPTIRAWSGKMRGLDLKVRYWQTYFRHLTKNSTSPITLYKCAQNAGITHSIKTTQ